jgi:hypothetical protein
MYSTPANQDYLQCSVSIEIELEGGAKPVAKPEFRLSPAEMDELKKQLSVLLKKGLVRLKESPWGAPVLFAPKRTEIYGCAWTTGRLIS